MALSGRCLCGAVRYATPHAPAYAFTCFCATCRRETGAGHATLVVVPEDAFDLIGIVKVVAPAREGGASPIPRTFCPECGTTLFARPPGLAGMISLRAGTLDGVVDLAIRAHAFVEQAQPWDQPPK